MKNCSKCKVVKGFEEFNKSSGSKDGYQNYCRECSKAKFKTWEKKPVKEDREGCKFCNTCSRYLCKSEFPKNPQGKHGVHSRCKECLSVYSKIKRSDSEYKKYLKTIGQNYAKNNRDKFNAKSARRRANRLSKVPKWADLEYEDFFLKEIYTLATLREDLTNIKWHVDHTVPLVSDYVSGLHWSENLRLITAKENLSKGNNHWPDMWE